MAHEVAEGDKIVVAMEDAWHHKTIILDHVFSAQEAISSAVPWTAEVLNLFACAPERSPHAYLAEKWGSKFLKASTRMIVRSDTGATIGEVGAGYEVIQPPAQFQWVDDVLEGSGLHYETAGPLQGGRVLFVLARVGEIDVLGSGDVSRTYLAFLNSYDGSLKAHAYLTCVRIVCANTMKMSLSDQTNVVSFKHTRGVHVRMNRAKELMQGVAATEASVKEKLELLAKRVIREKKTYTAILDALFPGEATRSENIKRDVTGLWEHNDGGVFPDWRGTAYALYNAVTHYVDHARTSRGEDKQASRFESALIGSGAKLKEKALETILTLTDGTELSHVTYFDAPVVGV